MDIFLTAPFPCYGEDDGGISAFFGPTLREECRNWLPSETRVRAKCVQFAVAGLFHVATYSMFNRYASLSIHLQGR